MPVTLNTPYDTGEMDDTDYAQWKIVSVSINLARSEMIVTYEFGNTVDDAWAPGKSGSTYNIIDNAAIGDDPEDPEYVPANPEYSMLMGLAEPDPGEKTYFAVKRGLYEHLITKVARLAGTVE